VKNIRFAGTASGFVPFYLLGLPAWDSNPLFRLIYSKSTVLMSGFFGCTLNTDCVKDVFYGTDYHSHLGTKRAGMAFMRNGKVIRSIHNLESNYFRSKFEDDLPKFTGSKSGIGVISDTESQPLTVKSHLGLYSLVTVSRIDNLHELLEDVLNHQVHFSEMSDSETNPSELVAILINQGNTFEEGIRNVQSRIKGSCSMLILTEKGIYAARDKFGRTPIIIGKHENGYAAASESCSFPNLDYVIDKYLEPGEAIFITPEGYEQRVAPNKEMQICSFLWVYYGYPSSCYENINVEETRYRTGAALGRRDVADNDTEADFVAGIPDSGVGHAVGYSNAKMLPYKRPFVKYTPTWPRSFMPQHQNLRDLVAKMKLLPNEAFTKDANVVFLDDSIVRGTQLKDNVIKLHQHGVKQVHMRIACPPLLFPCTFLNFSSSRSNLDLIARKVAAELEGTNEPSDEVLMEYADTSTEKYRKMVEEIRKRLDLTSLKFQYLDDLVEAIGLPKERLCTHCWDNSSKHFEKKD